MFLFFMLCAMAAPMHVEHHREAIALQAPACPASCDMSYEVYDLQLAPQDCSDTNAANCTYCAGGSCVKKKTGGTQCGSGNECLSNDCKCPDGGDDVCTDGLCNPSA